MESIVKKAEEHLAEEYSVYHRCAKELLDALNITKGKMYIDRSATLWEITNITHKQGTTHIHVTKVKKDGTLYTQHIHQSKFDMMTFIALKNAVEWVDN